jgi:hypothetical protein
MRCLKSILIGTIIIILSAVQSRADFPISFKLHLDQGTIYKLTMETTQSTNMIIEAKQQIMKQSNLIEYSYNIKSVDDNGNMLISARYDRVRFNSNMGPQVIEYDSNNPPDYYEPATIGFKATVGSVVDIKINPVGEILEILGIDEIIDNILLEADLPETQYKERFETDIRNQFGYEATKKAFEQITAFYPDQPIMLGETWTNDVSITAGFPISIKNEYKFISSENGISEISVNSTISSLEESDPITMGPISFIYDISGSQNGVIRVEEQTGLPMFMELIQEYEGAVTADGGDDEPSQTWPISSNSNTLIRFEKQ